MKVLDITDEIFYEKRDSNFFIAKKTTVQSVAFLIISCLERRGIVKTSDDGSYVLKRDIVDIRQLLDESDKSEEFINS